MLTNNDIKKLKQVFATKDDLKNFATKDDVYAVQKEVGSLRGEVSAVQKEVGNMRGDLKKYATKDDLRKAFRGVARKKDLRQMENRITKKINFVIDHFDSESIATNKRVGRIENHLHLTAVS